VYPAQEVVPVYVVPLVRFWVGMAEWVMLPIIQSLKEMLGHCLRLGKWIIVPSKIVSVHNYIVENYRENQYASKEFAEWRDERFRDISYDVAIKIAPLQKSAICSDMDIITIPIATSTVLYPIPEMVSSLNRLLTSSELGISVVPSYDSSLVLWKGNTVCSDRLLIAITKNNLL
jgi:hypothetical protein